MIIYLEAFILWLFYVIILLMCRFIAVGFIFN